MGPTKGHNPARLAILATDLLGEQIEGRAMFNGPTIELLGFGKVSRQSLIPGQPEGAKYPGVAPAIAISLVT